MKDWLSNMITDDSTRIQAILLKLTQNSIRWDTQALNCVDFAHIIYLRFFTSSTCLILQSADHVVCSVNGVLLDPMSNARITNFDWFKGGVPTESQCRLIDKTKPFHKLDFYYAHPAIKSYTLTKNYC